MHQVYTRLHVRTFKQIPIFSSVSQFSLLFMGKSSCSLLSLLVVLGVLLCGGQAELALNIPSSVAITSPDFQYVIACNKDGKQVPCQSNAYGLPDWMVLDGNVLKVKQIPLGNFYLNIVITAQDNSGDSTTKLVVAQVSTQVSTTLVPGGINLPTLNGVPVAIIHQQTSSNSSTTVTSSSTTTTTTTTTTSGKNSSLPQNLNNSNNFGGAGTSNLSNNTNTNTNTTAQGSNTSNNGNLSSTLINILNNSSNNQSTLNQNSGGTAVNGSTTIITTAAPTGQEEYITYLLRRQANANQVIANIIARLILLQRQGNQQLDTLIVERTTLEQEVQEIITKVTTMRQQLIALNNNITSYQKTIAGLQDSINSKRTEVQTVQNDITNTQNQIATLRDGDLRNATLLVTQAQTEVQRLNNIVTEAKRKIEAACNETILVVVQSNQARLNQLKAELQVAQTSITANTLKLARQDQLILDLEKQLEQARSDKVQIQTESNRLEANIPNLKAEIEALSTQVTTSQQSYTNCVNNATSQQEYLKAQNSLSTYRVTVLQQRINTQQKLQADLERLHATERTLKTRLSSLNQEIQSYQARTTLLQNQQNNSRNQITILNTQITELNTRLTTVTTRLDTLKTQISSATINGTDYQKYVQELEVAMVEKQLVDALVINLLIEANIYRNNTVNVPISRVVTSNSSVDLSSILSDPLSNIGRAVENSRDQGVGLYRIPGPGITSVQSPYVIDSQQCNFGNNTFLYGFGKITNIDKTNNSFTVQEDGNTAVIRFYSCSILLGSSMNFVPTVGDLVCFKALRAQDASLVVIEALVLHPA